MVQHPDISNTEEAESLYWGAVFDGIEAECREEVQKKDNHKHKKALNTNKNIYAVSCARVCLNLSSMSPTGAGGAVTVEEIIADEVGSYHELWNTTLCDKLVYLNSCTNFYRLSHITYVDCV